jgi:acetyl esterase/lipase
VPSTVSKEAAALISSVRPENLSPKNLAEWQMAWEKSEKGLLPGIEIAKKLYPARVERHTIVDVDHLLITPDTFLPKNKDRVVVYIHGGAHTMGSPESSLGLSLPAAHHLRTKVIAVRYPLAWKSPHPASRDLVVSLYKELLKSHKPGDIAMFGDSAGGALVMSTVLKLRDDNIAMPAVLGLISPWADISKTGDSLSLLSKADILIDYDDNLAASAKLYASGQDMQNPSISPLYANFEQGFPPAFISSGTRDLFLSHCVRLQRKLIDSGIENQLVVYEGMWHVFQSFQIPEAGAAWRDMTTFIERYWTH